MKQKPNYEELLKMITTTNWDKIYDDYCRECLNSDGDYSMRFIDWLKIKYP